MPAYFTNRAFAWLKMEKFGAALQDADAALALDPTFAKALYRKGSALMSLMKFSEAQAAFRAVVELIPNDRAARDKYEECVKTTRRLAFEEAIAGGGVQERLFEKLRWQDVLVAASSGSRRSKEGGEEEGADLLLLGDADPIDPAFCRRLQEFFRGEGRISRRLATRILCEAYPILRARPTLVDLTVAPQGRLTVCGDTHGQYYDVLNIFALGGEPSEQNPYLFNGDFVDRGSFSCEVILVLLAWVVALPHHMWLARGNHETLNMNRMYGFEGEVKAKYSERVFHLFTELFNQIPLCHVIQGRVFVTHGGLFAKDGVTLADLRAIDRDQQPPTDSLMSELLWSDPQPVPGRGPSKRGVGYSFGPDVTARFLELNGLELVVRSHEVKEEGYEVEAGGRLVTLFSAPNYCDNVGNKGAYAVFNDHGLPTYHSFTHVPHPKVAPMAYAGGGMGSMFF